MGFLARLSRRRRLARAARAPFCACTIATRDYLAPALVLLADLARHHPAASRVLLYLPAPGELAAPEIDGVRVIAAEELVDAAALALLRRRFTPAEACFALKAPLLSRLLEEGCGRAVYLDGDILLAGPLAEALAELETANAVLTPHLDHAIPDDGRLPTEATVLRAGVYNMGFVALRDSPETRRLLGWWGARARRFGFVRPLLGYQGDQNWMSLAPTIFEGIAVLRHPGYNLGYWNAHGRPVAGDAAAPTVAGLPLRFAHLSGFDPARPEALSRYQDRVSLAAQPVLAAMLRDYAARVRGAAGSGMRWRALPAPPPPAPPRGPRTAGAVPLPPEARRAYLRVSPAPPALEPGEELAFTVQVENRSDAVWHSLDDERAAHGVWLSWHLLDHEGRPLEGEERRVPLPHDLAPGESVLVDVFLPAPPAFGRFVAQFDLVQEGVAWFGAGAFEEANVPVVVGASFPPGHVPFT
ncbi:MAG: hypothetical protein KF738_15170 [Burkholderiales bacterium]|nr:hypothetical protein [Burkholderiales bacterium]